jgi:RNA polymerase sigma-70 factor (ECF subfamily)
MKSEEKKFLERVARDDKKALDQLYIKYREPFLAYFKKYEISDEEIKDLYQDTMIAFYQRGVKGKLSSLSSSIKTYVFGIGKNKAVDLIRKKKIDMQIKLSETEYESIQVDDIVLSPFQVKLRKHFNQLGESCKRMLTMFYYRGLDINDIVEIGGYKDANTVKSHKSRCLKKLRSLVNK